MPGEPVRAPPTSIRRREARLAVKMEAHDHRLANTLPQPRLERNRQPRYRRALWLTAKRWLPIPRGQLQEVCHPQRCSLPDSLHRTNGSHCPLRLSHRDRLFAGRQLDCEAESRRPPLCRQYDRFTTITTLTPKRPQQVQLPRSPPPCQKHLSNEDTPLTIL
jgi:hypothetical protein